MVIIIKMTDKKQNNFRYTFLIRVEATPEDIIAFSKSIESITDIKLGRVLLFADYIYFSLTPSSKPLSRNFFKGEAKGVKLTQQHCITIIQEV